MKRVAVYFFYDQDGIADRYVEYMLDGIAGCLQELVVVSNGPLTDQTRAMFKKYGKSPFNLKFHLLIRENKGFDVWAYKEAMELLGWETIDRYDELLLFNHTIMGPVYPFERVFEKMEEKELDFWGLNIHYGAEKDPFGMNPYGYLPPHLQSHFIVFRRRFTQTDVFRNYWIKMPEINSYGDSVGKHESYMTKYFSDQGFVWEAYADTEDLKEYTPYPLLDMPLIVLKRCQCPIFKRKNFFVETEHFVIRGASASAGSRLIEYLKENTDYDVSMIYENMARTNRSGSYEANTGLIRELIPDDGEGDRVAGARVAMFVDLDGYEHIWDFAQYRERLGVPVFLAAPGEESEKKRGWKNLFTGVDADYADYDYVCVVHPLRIDGDMRFGVIEHVEMALDEMFSGRDNLGSVLGMLEEHPQNGMVTALRPISMYQNIRYQWLEYRTHGNRKKELGDRLPAGSGLGVFVVRTSCLSQDDGEWISRAAGKEDYRGELLDMFLAASLHRRGYMTLCAVGRSGLLSSVPAAEAYVEIQVDWLLRLMNKPRSEKIREWMEAKLPEPLLKALSRGKPPKPGDPQRERQLEKIKKWLRAHLSERTFRAVLNAKRKVFGPRHGIYEDD